MSVMKWPPARYESFLHFPFMRTFVGLPSSFPYNSKWNKAFQMIAENCAIDISKLELIPVCTENHCTGNYDRIAKSPPSLNA